MVALRACVMLALCLVPSLAVAQPPTAGTAHRFFDPVFRGTIFCDTLDEVWRIATSETPDDAYANYRMTTNSRDEPICMAIAPTATVVEVTPIGEMVRNGAVYHAWAIETDVDGVRAFALYLERFLMAKA